VFARSVAERGMGREILGNPPPVSSSLAHRPLGSCRGLPRRHNLAMIVWMSELRKTLALQQVGDPGAKEELYTRFYPRVRDMVHRQLQHDFRRNHRWILPLFSTGDIVQEVFLGVVSQKLDGFSGDDEAAFVQYLGAVCRHRLLDALRFHEAARRDVRRRRDSMNRTNSGISPVANDPTPSLAASIGEQMDAYSEVMRDLSDKEQEVLRLRLEDQESFASIAETMGNASADAARQAFRTAKARLLVRLRAKGLPSYEESE